MKIGFIDYFLDEWHANNYPDWIKEASAGKLEVAFAYGLIDSPLGGLTSSEWCAQNNIALCGSIEEVVEKSDYLIVLSPDNSEMHEELCRIPLASGKPCYIDKTFAPTLAAAKKIFENAVLRGTPCYSTSALRFALEYRDIDRADIEAIVSWGPGSFTNYTIHQLEPVMMLMNAPAKRVLCCKNENCYTLSIDFENGRYASISGFNNGSPFTMQISKKSSADIITVNSDFFKDFIIEMVDFFETKTAKVEMEETLAIMAVWDAAQKAYLSINNWIEVER